MWLRIVAWRVSRSTTASTGTSSRAAGTAISPLRRRCAPIDHLVAADPVDVEHLGLLAVGQRTMPESATWPPPSA